MKTYRWKCTECGSCCINTISKTEIGTFGVFLLPHERKLFPPHIIKPLYGVGLKGRARPRPSFTFAYQMTASPCPYYNQLAKKCLIYEMRPLTCRQFPLSSTLRDIVLHRECPVLAQAIPEDDLVRRGQLKGFDNEFETMKILSGWYVSVYILNVGNADLGYAWYYDLEKDKWQQWSEGKLKEYVGKIEEKRIRALTKGLSL